MLVTEKASINTIRIVLQQGALPNAFTYTGRHWDPVARLYHYRARAYDPDTGSFLQHDPIPAANPYAYTDNDPVNFTDPLGLSKKGCEWQKYVYVNRNVCYGVKSDRCGPKCYKELKSSCATSEAPDGFKLWKDAWYSRCGCTKCVKIANTPSCEEICNGMPDTNTCIAQCKENKSRAQDNQGAGKNDGEPGEDVKTAPDDKGCQDSSSNKETNKFVGTKSNMNHDTRAIVYGSRQGCINHLAELRAEYYYKKARKLAYRATDDVLDNLQGAGGTPPSGNPATFATQLGMNVIGAVASEVYQMDPHGWLDIATDEELASLKRRIEFFRSYCASLPKKS